MVGIGLRFHFADYHYVGPTMVVDPAKGSVEKWGLQISMSYVPSAEAIASFYLVVGRTFNDMRSLPKSVATSECFEFEGIVVEERSEMVQGENLSQWSLRTPGTEFYIHARKLGAPVLKLIAFETLEKERLITLSRVEGVAEFNMQFEHYSGHSISWFQRRPDHAVEAAAQGAAGGGDTSVGATTTGAGGTPSSGASTANTASKAPPSTYDQ